MNQSAAGQKVLIMAGGTGGHVFPALTIAEELMARGTQVEWLGTRQGLEAKIIGNTSIPLHYISVSGLRGSNWFKKLLAPFVITVAIIQAMVKIRQIKPGCVLGMGGFVTGPGGVAAKILGKPVLIHEQNAVAGLTNYLLHPLASVVMEGFAGAFARKQAMTKNATLKKLFKSGKEQVVGNPVRKQLVNRVQGQAPQSEHALRLLIIGGSLGATAINTAVPQMLKLMPEMDRPEVLHQCGSRNLGSALAAYREAGMVAEGTIQVVPFIDDMAAAYQWADLVLCRSGASTIAELAAVGLPAILVPYPHAVDDHQSANASAMVQAGGAILLPQGQLNAESLKAKIQGLMADPQLLIAMGQAASSMANPEAANIAATLCLENCCD